MSSVISLAAVLPGQDVEIVRVLLRDGSGGPHRHLLPGRRLRCRYSGTVSVLLVSPTGETVSVRRDLARYVRVSTI